MCLGNPSRTNIWFHIMVTHQSQYARKIHCRSNLSGRERYHSITSKSVPSITTLPPHLQQHISTEATKQIIPPTNWSQSTRTCHQRHTSSSSEVLTEPRPVPRVTPKVPPGFEIIQKSDIPTILPTNTYMEQTGNPGRRQRRYKWSKSKEISPPQSKKPVSRYLGNKLKNIQGFIIPISLTDHSHGQ